MKLSRWMVQRAYNGQSYSGIPFKDAVFYTLISLIPVLPTIHMNPAADREIYRKHIDIRSEDVDNDGILEIVQRDLVVRTCSKIGRDSIEERIIIVLGKNGESVAFDIEDYRKLMNTANSN